MRMVLKVWLARKKKVKVKENAKKMVVICNMIFKVENKINI